MPITPVQLVGGSYTSRARSLDLSQSINCYIEPSADKKRGTLIGTPGLRLWTTLTDQARARALHGVWLAGCLRRQAGRSTSCSPIRPPSHGHPHHHGGHRELCR